MFLKSRLIDLFQTRADASWEDKQEPLALSKPLEQGEGGAVHSPPPPLCSPCNVPQPSATNCNDEKRRTEIEETINLLYYTGCNDDVHSNKEARALRDLVAVSPISRQWDRRTMKERGERWGVNASTASRWINRWSEEGLICTRREKRRVWIKLVETKTETETP